ncbi:MAG: hypothetical protein ACRELV_09870, partial [Longimicrobiales bacterium]
MRSVRRAWLFVLITLALPACGDGAALPVELATTDPARALPWPLGPMPGPASAVPVLVGAGDIADCASPG